MTDRPTIANSTYYAEYASYGAFSMHSACFVAQRSIFNGHNPGPGADNTARVPVEHILNSTEAENFTVEGVFLEQPAWIDYDYTC